MLNTKEILEQVQSGQLTVEQAEAYFRRQTFEDLGFAKLDNHRRMRSGFAQVLQDKALLESHGLELPLSFSRI